MKAIHIVYDDSYNFYEETEVEMTEEEFNQACLNNFDDPYCYGEQGSFQGGAGNYFVRKEKELLPF